MITVSLCMIVKNEEDTLERCLESVKDLVDEIIIVDTGSDDATKQIAEKYTDKIFDFKWVEDFSAARNYSFSKATKEYILWLDADDIITRENSEKIKILMEAFDPSIDMVMMKYNAGLHENGRASISYFRERLVKRSMNYQWFDPVHEHLGIYGNILNADICITHQKVKSSDPERNLRIFEKMIAEGKELSPRNLFYYARELYFHNRYEDAILNFNKFLDTERGWVEDNICACMDLSRCYGLINQKRNRIKTLLRSFEYDAPRAEACCELGYHYKELEDYRKAAFWFKLATLLKKPEANGGFIQHDYWDYIPYMELCVCFDKLGNLNEAVKWNEMAASIKPMDPSVEFNKKYFAELMKNDS